MACTQQMLNRQGGVRAAPFTSASPKRVHPRVARQPLSVRASSSSGLAADAAAPIQKLKEACRTKQVAPEEVISAMEQVEASHAKSSLVEGFPAALDGTWRLVFASPGPPLIKSWQYIPVKEDAEIDLAAGTIALVGYLGPLCNRFKGKCRFESDPSTGAYNMVFGWEQLETTFFSWKSVKELTPKEKVYSFFVVQGELAAANSSGTGGKTLMFRVQE